MCVRAITCISGVLHYQAHFAENVPLLIAFIYTETQFKHKYPIRRNEGRDLRNRKESAQIKRSKMFLAG